MIESPRKKLPPRQMSIASYENIDDLISLNSNTSLVIINQPVHAFPIEIFPPVIIDPITNKKINMTENMIQPQIYMNQNNTLCVCDCECCDCQDSCDVCVGGVVAALAGLGGVLCACGNTQASSTPFDCGALFPDSCCFNMDSCCSCCASSGESSSSCNCSSCLPDPNAPVGPSLCDTIGFESVCGNCVGDITTCVTASASECYNGVSQCSAAATNCFTDCYVSCLASIQSPFQVMYNELHMCYRQVTSCC